MTQDRVVKVAAVQIACSWDRQDNLNKLEKMIRAAAADGAQVILLQELFESPYFCIEIKLEHLGLATALKDNPSIKWLQALCAELAVVIPFSWYEKASNVLFNSVAMVDADGEILGTYRKTHIPDSDGYLEKYYFSPGDTGFKVWNTRYAKIGVGICWDQWFPETARSMSLAGAELLLYPTAIGSEPKEPDLDSMPHWRRTMQGHAAANQVPVIAANRVGKESAETNTNVIDFYGSSFITDHQGEIQVSADRQSETYITHSLNLSAAQRDRHVWGLYRDRRPEHYSALQHLDVSDQGE